VFAKIGKTGMKKYVLILFTDTKYFSFNNKRKNLAKVVMRKSQLLLFLGIAALCWHFFD